MTDVLDDIGVRSETSPGASRRPALTEREIEVLREWLCCDSKSEAAARLFLSPATVGTHIARIREKYALVGRPAATKTALFVRALQDRLIAIDEV